MSLLALLNLNDGGGGTVHDAAPLALGVVALIVVALLAVALTLRLAARRPRVGRPRRGTTALLLAAIATVLLMLTSVSQRRIASLTIVSHAAGSRSMQARRGTAPAHRTRRLKRSRAQR